MIRLEVNHRAGLGSIFSILMSHLHRVPDNETAFLFANSSHYAEPSDNCFEWYFTNPRFDAAIVWPDLQIDIEHYPFNTLLGYDKVQLARLRHIRNRFFHPKPEMPNMARHIIARSQRTLGIHYRGTDKINEIPRIPVGDFLAKTARIMTHDAIFLATDDEGAANWFRAHMPAAWMNEHKRTTSTEGLHILHGGRQQADEAMLDMWCLSMCDTLLLSRGNFSDMAAIFSATDDIHYCEAA